MSKTVYILGAGASISHSNGVYPSYNEFFSKARALNIINRKDSGNVLDKYKDLKDYIYKLMGEDILEEKSRVDIERLLTFIDIDIDKSDNINLHKNYEKKFLVLEIILDLLEQLSNRVNKQKGDYHSLIKKINHNDTIITFNWDTLLDKILLNNKKGQIRNLVDLIHNDRDPLTLNEPTDSYELSQKGIYLKLHGSVDWKYCSNKYCNAYNKIFTSKSKICGECYKQLNSLIIPPILNKQYRSYPFIEKLWKLAFEQLKFTHNLVIWGYKLPSTDFYSNWLLSKTKDNLKNVYIINPDCVLPSKEKKEKPRINRKNFLNAFIEIYKEENLLLFEYFFDYLKNKYIFH